ncbi:MAG TPA: hypothetical protein PKW35_20435 [Nannocystaceae bacterium]|nr:hypothetical protein [Nannocystaceae bacterium]
MNARSSLLSGGLLLGALTMACSGDDTPATTATAGGTGTTSTSSTTDGTSTATESTGTTGTGTSTSSTGTTSTTSTSGESTGTTTSDTTTGDTTTGTTGDTTDTTTGGLEGCVPADLDIPDPHCADPGNLVYVATPVNGGSDINDGKSKVTPVATLAKAIEIAQTCDPVCDVVVSAGTYPKTVTLASGIDLFGGYAPKTFMWDQVANEVKIEASENKAVIADGLNVKTRFFGFTVKAQSYMSDGASSYAFWVRNVADDNLAIEHSRVLAGNGGKGLDGPNGAKGDDGGLGGKANAQAGGLGGTAACGAGGGKGGLPVLPVFLGQRIQGLGQKPLLAVEMEKHQPVRQAGGAGHLGQRGAG